jgi:hypothetical protein
MTDTAPLVGREVVGNIKALARFLAGATDERPTVASLTLVALQEDPTILEWLRREFEKANTVGETIWEVEPYTLDADPTDNTLGLAVGVRDTQPAMIVRVYRIEGATLHDSSFCNDPAEIQRRKAMVEGRMLIKASQATAHGWTERAIASMRQDMRLVLDKMTDPGIRAAIEQILAKEHLTLQDILLVYVIAHEEPTMDILFAIRDTRPRPEEA